MVTIFDSSDLGYAIQYCHILKLRIFIKEGEPKSKPVPSPGSGYIPPDELLVELRTLRDTAIKLLDIFEDSDHVESIGGGGSSSEKGGTRSKPSSKDKSGMVWITLDYFYYLLKFIYWLDIIIYFRPGLNS